MSAASDNARLYFVRESTWNEAAASATMTEVPYRSNTIKGTEEFGDDDEIRADRQVSGANRDGQSAGGDLGIFLKHGVYQDFFEALMSDAFSTPVAETACSVASATTVTKTGLHTNIVVGQFIKLTGSTAAANNGLHEVTGVATDTLTLGNSTLTSGGTTTVRAEMARNGTTDVSYRLEKNFSDISAFRYVRGARIGGLSLSIVNRQKITGSFSWLAALEEKLASVGGTRNGFTATDPMSASVNVGSILVDGSALSTKIQSIELTIDAGLRNPGAVGQVAAAGVNYGKFRVSGTINAYFDDDTFTDLREAATYFKLSIPVTDDAGNSIVLTLPRCKALNTEADIPATGSDLVQPVAFQAVVATGGSYTLQMDHIAGS